VIVMVYVASSVCLGAPFGRDTAGGSLPVGAVPGMGDDVGEQRARGSSGTGRGAGSGYQSAGAGVAVGQRGGQGLA
jgi:hypothetical protein